jgi:hypothetical protein
MTENAEPKQQENTPSKLPNENILTSVSGSLAAMFLQRSLRKGYGMSIPSLGIKIEQKKLFEKSTNQNNTSDETGT